MVSGRPLQSSTRELRRSGRPSCSDTVEVSAMRNKMGFKTILEKEWVDFHHQKPKSDQSHQKSETDQSENPS